MTRISRRGRLWVGASLVLVGLAGLAELFWAGTDGLVLSRLGRKAGLWLGGEWAASGAWLVFGIGAGGALGAGLRFLVGRTYLEAMEMILVGNALDRVGDFTPSGAVRWWTAGKTLLVRTTWVLVLVLVGWGVGTHLLGSLIPGLEVWFALLLLWVFGWIWVGYDACGPILDELVNIVGMGSGLVIANNTPGFDLRDVRGWRMRGLPTQSAGRMQMIPGDSLSIIFYTLAEWLNRQVIRASGQIGNALRPKGVELFLGMPDRSSRKVVMVFPSLQMAGVFDAFLQEVIGSKQ